MSFRLDGQMSILEKKKNVTSYHEHIRLFLTWTICALRGRQEIRYFESLSRLRKFQSNSKGMCLFQIFIIFTY